MTSTTDRDIKWEQERVSFLARYGVTWAELHSMDVVALLDVAFAKPPLFKIILRELHRQRWAPERVLVVERHLVQAYRQGAAAWVVAVFLRFVPTRVGYELAREILLGGGALQSESYATEVILAVDASAARGDLLAIISDPHNSALTRRCAGKALAHNGDPALVPVIVDSVRARRLGVARASAVMRGLGLPPEQLVSWLDDADDAVARVGFYLAMRLANIDARLAKVMRRALDAERIPLSPMEREWAEARLAKGVGGRD